MLKYITYFDPLPILCLVYPRIGFKLSFGLPKHVIDTLSIQTPCLEGLNSSPFFPHLYVHLELLSPQCRNGLVPVKCQISGDCPALQSIKISL